MDSNTADTGIETAPVAETAAPVVAAAPKAPKVVVKAPAIPLADAAIKIAEANPALVVRPTDSKTYRILGTAENTDINWKKGIFYVLNTYATGLRLELQFYSTSGGGHLKDIAPEFKKFDGADVGGEKVEYTNFGLAGRLRFKLPNELGMDGMVAQASAVIALVNADVLAALEKVVLPEKAVKAKKAKKVVSATDATSAPAAKKAGKTKSKSKSKAPVVVAPEAPAVDASVDAAVADLTAE